MLTLTCTSLGPMNISPRLLFVDDICTKKRRWSNGDKGDERGVRLEREG
jgi:hypothetical protein